MRGVLRSTGKRIRKATATPWVALQGKGVIMKRLLLAFSVVLAAFALPARATDYSGMWWNPAESGWGAEITHQNNTMFVTLYVYDGANQPTWYFASNVTKGSGAAWSGTLYRATGAPFYGAWGTPPVGVTNAGTLTFTPTSAHNATLQYTVVAGAAVAVSKSIERYTFESIPVAGTYYGGFQGTYSCLLIGSSTPKDRRGDLSFNVTGSSIVMSTSFTSGQGCQFAGTLEQHGKQYKIINGSWQCNTPTESGDFTADEVTVTDSGFYGKYRISASSGILIPLCSENGNFGGVKH